MKSKPNVIEQHKESSTKLVDEILVTMKKDIGKIEDTTLEIFPFALHELSKAAEEFEKSLSKDPRCANPILEKAIPIAVDQISGHMYQVQVIETWISHHIPPIEDGNNFGVGIQHAISNSLLKKREKLSKSLLAIPNYYSERADCVEKLDLPRVSKSTTKTDTKTESKGGKDGDENKTSSVVTTEEKNEEDSSDAKYFRMKHLVSIDVRFYAFLRAEFADLIRSYVVVINGIENNRKKLVQPKGTQDENRSGWY